MKGFKIFHSFYVVCVIFLVYSYANLLQSQPVQSNPTNPNLSEDFLIHFGILESHGTNILLIDPETGTILRANRAARDFYGYPSLVGMKIQEINTLPPDKIREEMQNAARQNRNYFLFKHKTASGQIKSVEVYSYPIQFQGKSVLLSIIHDVTKETFRSQMVFNISMAALSGFLVLVIFYLIRAIVERKKAEQNLMAIQNSLEYAQEIANMGSWELDVTNHRSTWSKNFYNLLGYRLGTVTPSHSLFLQSLYPEDLKIYKKAEETIIRTRKPGTVEVRYYSQNHEVHWCRIHLSPIYVNDELSMLKAAVVDITETKEYEIKFKSQLSYLEIALDISRDFMNVSSDDFESLIHRSLEKIQKKFQVERVSLVKFSNQSDDYSIQDAVFEPGIPEPEDTFLGENLSKIPEAMRKSQSGQIYLVQDVDRLSESFDVERKYLLSRGTVALMGIPIMHHGDLIGYLALESTKKRGIFDEDKILSLQLISELFTSVFLRRKIYMNLVRKTEEASLANKAKSIFLSNISHEIRTPLNGVLGFTELLMQTELSPTQKEYLTSINISARALLEIITNLLDLSRIESGKFELEEGTADLNQLIQEALNILRYSMEVKGLSYRKEIPEGIPLVVKLDYQRIRQVLVNLLSNAVKFTHQGEIVVELKYEYLSENKGKYTFYVKDTGIGISTSLLFQIRKNLQQDKGELAKRYSGSGIGLAISNSILKLYNSELEIESQEGVGSQFFFSLVLEWFPENSIQENGKNQTLTQLQPQLNCDPKEEGKKILVVEDVELNLLLIEKLIHKFNPRIQILEAKDGLEAVDFYKKECPDLIFMDVNLPKLSGIEATREIREYEKANPNRKKVPIICLTAGVTKEELKKNLEAGMDEILTKPVRSEDIEQVILKYLKNEIVDAESMQL